MRRFRGFYAINRECFPDLGRFGAAWDAMKVCWRVRRRAWRDG